MKTSPLVSIIVPVYNSERYLRYCVESLLAQTYRNIEIILIDDGSKDASGDICDEFAKRDNRVRVIHQSNGGISKAQNAGLDIAEGTYITFCDNDDIAEASLVEFLVHAIEKTGADIAKGRWDYFGESTLESVAKAAKTPQENPESITVFHEPLRAYLTIFCKSLRILQHQEPMYFNESNWCELYRRELWEGVRFPIGRFAQDVFVNVDVYKRANTVADVNAVLYHWFQSSGSVTHSARTVQFYDDNAVAGLYMFECAVQEGISPDRAIYATSRVLSTLFPQAKDFHDEHRAEHEQLLEEHRAHYRELWNQLTMQQRLQGTVKRWIRSAETFVYDRKIHTMK